MISIIITAYKEPNIHHAIEAIIRQRIDEEHEIIIAAPDKATLDIAKKYTVHNKRIKLFQDPGKGKSYALNLLLPKLKGRIIILTDGDIYVGRDSINYLMEKFSNQEVGCVSGHPIPQDSKNNMFGYWSHVLCYSAHRLREARAKKNQFLECSGYLWAFRNGVIKKFPKDVAEDTIVPILFYRKGWKIDYAENALVYVKYPDNIPDFIEQKKRTAKSHETLSLYVNDIPRMKTFFNEIMGSFIVLGYPKTLTELGYTLWLFPLRLQIWLITFYHKYVKNDYYHDAWKRVDSAR